MFFPEPPSPGWSLRSHVTGDKSEFPTPSSSPPSLQTDGRHAWDTGTKERLSRSPPPHLLPPAKLRRHWHHQLHGMQGRPGPCPRRGPRDVDLQHGTRSALEVSLAQRWVPRIGNQPSSCNQDSSQALSAGDESEDTDVARSVSEARPQGTTGSRGHRCARCSITLSMEGGVPMLG